MLTKPVEEINFVGRTQALASVEIDLYSLPDDMYGWEDIVLKALKRIVVKSKQLRATVYAREMPSVNFGYPTSSVFFGIAGGEAHLPTLLATFQGAGITARMSDSFQARQSDRHFHIEDGAVWYPEDSVTWQTSSKRSSSSKKSG